MGVIKSSYKTNWSCVHGILVVCLYHIVCPPAPICLCRRVELNPKQIMQKKADKQSSGQIVQKSQSQTGIQYHQKIIRGYV